MLREGLLKEVDVRERRGNLLIVRVIVDIFLYQ